MLTDYIDMPANTEHSLPWYPPICEHPNKDKDKSIHFPAFLHQLASTTSLRSHPFLRKHFLHYVNDGKSEESEIGQRIITAMKKVKISFGTLSAVCLPLIGLTRDS